MNEQQSAPAPEGQGIELRVTMDAQGHVHVHGPITMEVLCLGILEKAKQTIQAYNARLKALKG